MDAFEDKAKEIAKLDICDNPELVAAIVAALQEAVAIEREECAKICDPYGDSVSDHEAGTALNIADAIRARGK